VRFRILTCLAVLALGAGCGSDPEIRPIQASSVIVAFGDSITAGTGAEKPESYPARLSERLGCRVVNAGVPGEETPAGLRRLPGVLSREDPDLVILCLGGNDMLSKRTHESIRANLGTMIELVKDSGADLVLLGVPKPGLLLRPPPFYEELAEAHHIPLDRTTIPDILSTPSEKSNQIHPNADGYARLANAVAALIRDSQGD